MTARGALFLRGGIDKWRKSRYTTIRKAVCFTLARERMRDVQEKDLKIGLLCDFYGRMLTDKQREATAYILTLLPFPAMRKEE